MPVLAKQAVRGAAGIKHSQVVVPWMITSFANPISYTIGRQGIAIPIQHAVGGSTSEVDQVAILNSTQAAKSKFALVNLAIVAAQFARNTSMLARRFAWKTEFLASALVVGSNGWVGYGESIAQAIPTYTDRF